MKKIILLFLALLVLSIPLQQNYLQVDAAVASKAASKTAQKIAKEYIKDAAIMKSANMIVDTAKHIPNDGTRMQKEGFMMICMDYTYTKGGKCDKPVNVKSTLTETDKTNLGKQVEIELDKKTGTTKWMKFLDWFLPIWLVTFSVTAITYALDPDVKSLFDEVAYDSLVALGLISPVTDMTQRKPIEELVSTKEPEPSSIAATETIETDALITRYKYSYDSNMTMALTGISQLHQDMTIKQKLVDTWKYGHSVRVTTTYPILFQINQQKLFEVKSSNIWFAETWFGNSADNIMTIQYNGVPIKTVNSSVTNPNQFATDITSETGVILANEYAKLQSIMYRAPYKQGDFWYTDLLFNTTDGNIIKYQMRTLENNVPQEINQINTSMHSANPTQITMRLIVEKNQAGYKDVIPPVFAESGISPTDASQYNDENGNIALLPPAAFTYIDETTGEQVERKPAPTGDGYTWQKPDGTEVPEENVIPKPDEEPKVTPSPDGTPQYTPAPTPSNPTPEPVPLTPNPTAPPTEPPAEEPPLEPFPDGAKCDAKLQFPIFSPLKEQLSTSFPFSIPWDIERAAHAAFDGVGNEKPSFEMVIPVGDDKHYFDITTPAFLDDWKPFMDGFLLLTFDLLLMFGLYRFVKGAGS